jgi:tetratricopeptide (TPR) repeat protein
MVSAVLGLAAGCVYLLTLSPTVYLGDSGELSAAAFCLGVPHASGYPLYMLVGKVFCLLPFGDVGFRMNLMSAVFGGMAVGLVCSLIWRMSGSKVGAWVGGGVLAFIPVFWWQTVAAEVYAPHVFFVVLMMWLLWRWEETREFYILVVFSFVTGLSFGNHLQTVMLAPAVYYLILSGDRKVLLDGKRFLVLAVFFVLPFLVYGYLPIRTWAGAAMHWGDPDSWDRFWVHVSGRAHRSGYVFNLGVWEYVERLKESVEFVWVQFGVLALVGVWGWWRIRVVRWRVFLLGVVVFDLLYTVFLNTISLEITPFNLSVCVVLAIGIGIGVGEGVRWCERRGARVVGVLKVGCGVIPLMFVVLNYRVSDQSENYTAYEHALNIFRTADSGAVLLMNGDNYIFPVTYGRIVERMREDVTLYDRNNILFKMPGAARGIEARSVRWEEKRNQIEKNLIGQNPERNIYYAVFGPYAVDLPPSCELIPEGVLYSVFRKEHDSPPKTFRMVWKYYSTESFYGNFERDFMNREVCAYFFFDRGQELLLSGQRSAGLQNLRLAREIGYNDNVIHSDMGVFFADHGFFEEARLSLEKALLYHEDLSGVYNNWGYYYDKIGEHEKAVASFRKAVELRPDRFFLFNNLGFALVETGKMEEAAAAFKESLSLHQDQPGVRKFMKDNLMKDGKDHEQTPRTGVP